MASYKQGRFKPINPQKYIGDVNNIIYRSSWELKYLMYLDRADHIISYGSEEMAIPYVLEDLKTGKKKSHRYFPDMIVKAKAPDGVEKKFIVEIKPYAQTIEPTRAAGKSEKRYLTEVLTYRKNKAKWEAAERFCSQHDVEFVIITEKELNIKYK